MNGENYNSNRRESEAKPPTARARIERLAAKLLDTSERVHITSPRMQGKRALLKFLQKEAGVTIIGIDDVDDELGSVNATVERADAVEG